jgi:hypothetical protein
MLCGLFFNQEVHKDDGSTPLECASMIEPALGAEAAVSCSYFGRSAGTYYLFNVIEGFIPIKDNTVCLNTEAAQGTPSTKWCG